jgi:hypothetical protein
MQIYYEKEEEIEKLNIQDLDNLGKNLFDFIREYKMRILMTEDDKKTMAKLEVIANNIKYRQYHMLVMDTNLISQLPKEENDEPPFDGPYTKKQ